MKNVLIYVIILIFNTAAFAQTRAKSRVYESINPKNLSVGDVVPDFLIENIINDKRPSVRISDFKNRLLIIDFWATNCSGCVAALPKMEALQKEFGDKIKILPVTYEPRLTVHNFLKNNRLTKELIIPTVVGDKTLSKWFQHQYIPHEVWIYKGKVVAFTGSDYVDADNIRFILADKKNDWPVKYDFYPPFDYNQPLLKVNEKHIDIKRSLNYYSTIFGYLKRASFKQGVTFDTLFNTRRNYIINSTILGAYFNNWGKIRELSGVSKHYFPDKNRTILEVKDPEKYSSIKSAKYLEIWKQKHLFCYESLSLNDGKTEIEQCQKIIQDLDHLLALHGRYEVRKIKCLILVLTDEGKKLVPGTGNPEFVKDLPLKKINNISLKSFVEILNREIEGIPPIFDETNYSETVNMNLNLDSFRKIPEFRASLQPYGLDLKEEERDLEVFVLTELGK